MSILLCAPVVYSANYDDTLTRMPMYLSVHCSNETNQNLYGIKGYSQVNNYRPEKRGGGVSLFFNESLEYCRRNALSIMNSSIESFFVDVSPNPLTQNKCVTLGVIYRPPNTDVRNFLENMSMILVNLKYINRTVYIMGDFEPYKYK